MFDAHGVSPDPENNGASRKLHGAILRELLVFHQTSSHERERRMEGSREGGEGAEREAGSEGGREAGRQGGREAGRQGGREAVRERGHLRRRSDSSSYRVCNGAHPSHSSTLHFRNIASVWSLPEMSSVRHDVDEITCGRAPHAGFSLPVAPQMFRFRGDSLSRAHSLAIRHVRLGSRALLFWVDVIFLQVALGSLQLFLPLRDTSFCGLTQERLEG